MKCLLFGGAQSVGKSESIYRLTQYLLTKNIKDVLGLVPPVFKDFSAVLEGFNQKGVFIRVIVNTATDTPAIIAKFKMFYDLNGNYDILISSVRDNNFWPRAEFFNIMGISPATHYIMEIPLAKISRRGGNFKTALAWYEKNVDLIAQHILSVAPYNL